MVKIQSRLQVTPKVKITDQITTKGVYTQEANEEIENFNNSIGNFINFGGSPSKIPGSDVSQSLYSLTKVLSDTTLTKNIEFA